MKNILELDKQRYSGEGIPHFLQFYRKAQMSRNPIFHKIYKKLLRFSQRKMELSFLLIQRLDMAFMLVIHME